MSMNIVSASICQALSLTSYRMPTAGRACPTQARFWLVWVFSSPSPKIVGWPTPLVAKTISAGRAPSQPLSLHQSAHSGSQSALPPTRNPSRGFWSITALFFFGPTPFRMHSRASIVRRYAIGNNMRAEEPPNPPSRPAVLTHIPAHTVVS